MKHITNEVRKKISYDFQINIKLKWDNVSLSTVKLPLKVLESLPYSEKIEFFLGANTNTRTIVAHIPSNNYSFGRTSFPKFNDSNNNI